MEGQRRIPTCKNREQLIKKALKTEAFWISHGVKTKLVIPQNCFLLQAKGEAKLKQTSEHKLADTSQNCF